mmetsp:Transcript_10134/g.25371  ORF Transcript_10134/g.25371 Transcript_10134/m.25371 type:complete len:286 (+) Transcript_10134:241-1098(+)
MDQFVRVLVIEGVPTFHLVLDPNVAKGFVFCDGVFREPGRCYHGCCLGGAHQRGLCIRYGSSGLSHRNLIMLCLLRLVFVFRISGILVVLVGVPFFLCLAGPRPGFAFFLAVAIRVAVIAFLVVPCMGLVHGCIIILKELWNSFLVVLGGKEAGKFRISCLHAESSQALVKVLDLDAFFDGIVSCYIVFQRTTQIAQGFNRSIPKGFSQDLLDELFAMLFVFASVGPLQALAAVVVVVVIVFAQAFCFQHGLKVRNRRKPKGWPPDIRAEFFGLVQGNAQFSRSP